QKGNRVIVIAQISSSTPSKIPHYVIYRQQGMLKTRTEHCILFSVISGRTITKPTFSVAYRHGKIFPNGESVIKYFKFSIGPHGIPVVSDIIDNTFLIK